VEAEQGKKLRVKPKKQKQLEMQAGWLQRVDHAGKKGPRTRSMGLQIDYLDDHRTDPAKKGGGKYGQKRAAERRSSETIQTTCT
jgi:hypothetical protein